jgi:hypothetical protein
MEARDSDMGDSDSDMEEATRKGCVQVDADGRKNIFVRADGDGFAAHHELEIVDEVDREEDGAHDAHNQDDPVVTDPEDADEYDDYEGKARNGQESSKPATGERIPMNLSLFYRHQ